MDRIPKSTIFTVFILVCFRAKLNSTTGICSNMSSLILSSSINVCPLVSAHVEAVKRLSSDDSNITDREQRHVRAFLVHASGDLHKANEVLVDLLVFYPLGKWATEHVSSTCVCDYACICR